MLLIGSGHSRPNSACQDGCLAASGSLMVLIGTMGDAGGNSEAAVPE